MGEPRTAGDDPEVTGAKPWTVVMTWGVILGIGGIVLTIFAPQLFGPGFSGATALPLWALNLYSVVSSAMFPFSAALIGAAIVMRYLHALVPTRRTGTAVEGPPSD